jgi:hypothetical protein
METRTIRTIGKELCADSMRAELRPTKFVIFTANSNATRYGGLWKSKALRNGDVSVKTKQSFVFDDSKAK